MYRNILVSLAIAAILVGSQVAPVSALTADEIQAQIKELLAKVEGLTAQLNALRSGNTGTDIWKPIHPFPTPRICALLNRNLVQGAEGDDVRALQEFLQEEKIFTGNATGYFGPITARAVASWQAREGVSSVGAFGPVSRERLKIKCGGGWGNTERFSASPTRGEAPLTVTFDTWLSGFRVNTVSYSIDYGDGTSERAADCPAPADACTGPGQNKHTYASNGTYTATLNKITDPCPDDGDPTTPRCLAAVQSEVVAKQQIVVGPVACTKEYRPVCGGKPIVCITTPCNPIPTTYSNRCMMAADGASFMYEGQCRGTGDPANKPPIISGISGPTSLGVNTQGTWSISASDPEGGTLSYQISWGDERGMGMNSTAPARESAQTSTFTHSYSAAGTYTVSIVVYDNAGQSAKSTTTVRVGDVACTLQYDPVCGRPSGCANTCAPGMACPAICQLHNPQTYGNRCQMNAAGAQFLHSGQCTSTSGSIY